MTKSEIQLKINTLKLKVNTLKTNKAKQKVWNDIFNAEHQLRHLLLDEVESLNNQYGNEVITGTVLESSYGETLIQSKFGRTWINNCNDAASKSWYNETCCVEYIINQNISFKVKFEVEGLSINCIPVAVSGGHVNEVQYAKLNATPGLAFFKYNNSNEVTGLFA